MERKLRKLAGSLVIALPKQLCDVYNFKDGDRFTIESS